MIGFNPLVIGSIFQTKTSIETPTPRPTWFQSPSNRVNIPNVARVLILYVVAVLSFNPLVIGSIFQT